MSGRRATTRGATTFLRDHDALEELRFGSLKRGWAWKWDGTDLTQVPMGRVSCPRGCEFDGMTGVRPPCDADACPGFVVDVEGHRTYADPADAILAARRLPPR